MQDCRIIQENYRDPLLALLKFAIQSNELLDIFKIAFPISTIAIIFKIIK